MHVRSKYTLSTVNSLHLHVHLLNPVKVDRWWGQRDIWKISSQLWGAVSGIQTPSLNHSRLSEWNIWNWLVWLLNFTRSATCSCTCVITQSSSSAIPGPSACHSLDDVCECTRLTNQRTHHSLSAASRGQLNWIVVDPIFDQWKELISEMLYSCHGS